MAKAKGIHDHPNYKLGKQEHKHDDKTMMLANFFEVPVVPSIYDFEKHRRPFPVHMWGNDEYGDCVIAAEANALLRMERVEQRRTIGLADVGAINRYKSLTGCREPGDENDVGLVILDTMSDWRNNGYKFHNKVAGDRYFTIAAYGELEPADTDQLRAAIYLLGGIHLGVWLPISAQAQTDQGYWDVTDGPDSAPGSWGGHCIYACKYDEENIYVKTWGMEVRVTNAFIKKYCDEVWGVVDNLDKWRTSGHLDVQGMLKYLHDIGAKNIG